MSRRYSRSEAMMEPNYFSNWGDLLYPALANKLLKPASKIKFLTPNIVSLVSFALYALAAVSIVVSGPWSFAAVILLPVSYILDCLDGQLARYNEQASRIGDYLDKTLDVFKIGIINGAFSLAAYNMTGNTIFFILGFVSCFGFMLRYYIKLETMFSEINSDKNYLDKSRARRHELYSELGEKAKSNKTIVQKIQWLWFRNKSIFALDEAEHVTFGAIAAAMQRPDVWLWVFGVGQAVIAIFRLFERGYKLAHDPESLTYPLRK